MPSMRGRAYYQREGAGFNPRSAIAACCAVKPSSRDRRSCLLDDGVERGGLLDCKIGQHFPIDQNSGLAYAVDEATIGEAKRAHRCIETLNPESTECAFSPLAVAIDVLIGLLGRLLGNANGIP